MNRDLKLCVDAVGAAYLAGAYGEYRPEYQNRYQIKIVKYDNSGEREWELNVFDQYYAQDVGDLAIDSEGGIYISASYFNPYISPAEFRTFVKKYSTGADAGLVPVFSLVSTDHDPWASSLVLQGQREAGSSVSVSVDKAATISAILYPTETTWSCDISGLAVGQYQVTARLNSQEGVTRELLYAHQVFPRREITQEWVRQYDTATTFRGASLAAKEDGSLLLVGSSRKSWGTDLMNPDEDLLLLHVSADGSLLETPWQEDLGGSDLPDIAIDNVVDPEGNHYLLWRSWYSGFVAKFDAHGNELWRSEIDRKNQQNPKALSVDAAGNVFVCGYTTVSLQREPFGGVADYFVIKFNALGEQQWLRLSGEPDYLIATDIAIDPAGFIWLSGWKLDPFDAYQLPLLIKLDSLGLPVAEQVVDPHEGRATEITVRGDSVYVAGVADFQRGTATDLFLLEFDRNFNLRWHRNLQQDQVDVTAAMEVAADGSIVLAGKHAPTLFRANDAVVHVFDHDGSPLSRWDIATALDDQGFDVSTDQNGGIYLAGMTEGVLAGEETFWADMFLAKLQTVTGPDLQIDPYPEVTGSLSQTISGRVSAETEVVVTVHEPAQSTATVSGADVASDGNWSFTVNDLVPNVTNLLRVAAVNETGTTTQLISITVDTLPPALSIDPVTSPTDQDSQVVTGLAESGATVSVEVPLLSVSETLPVQSGLWSYVASGLLEGENLLHFTAVDAAGNRSSETVVVTYVPPAPMAAALSPATLPENMAVDAWLSVTNLHPVGGTLAVEQRVDLDRNGTVDVGDPVVRRFALTDGVVHNNQNVPSDLDAMADGAITARLSYQRVNDRFHAPAAYLFQVAGDSGFAEAAFEVQEVSEIQAISGQVADDMGQPVQGAFVALTDLWGREYGYAVTDAAGRYWLQVESPGEYLLRAMAEGFYFDTTSMNRVSLTAGQVVGDADMQLHGDGYHVAGQILDAATGEGLPGLLVSVTNALCTASGLTTVDGVYSLRVPEGQYEFSINPVSGDGLATKGYLAPGSSALSLEITADTVAAEIQLTAADGLISGRVVDITGLPVPGVPLQAVCLEDCGLAFGDSDSSGRYTLGVLTDASWEVTLQDEVAQPLGWIAPFFVISSESGLQSDAPEMRVLRTDAQVEGQVADIDNHGIADVVVQVDNQTTGSRAVARTGVDGRYQLGIDAGVCSVSVETEPLGYDPVLPVMVDVAAGETVSRDFVVTGTDLSNTIVVSSAVYNQRKAILAVTASSRHADAQLVLEGYGAMTMTKELKGTFTWVFSGPVPLRPETVTVSGPEGRVTAEVTLK